MPKVQSVVEIVRRRTMLGKPMFGLVRTGSFADDKRRLLEDDGWEVIQRDDALDGRLARSKSEMRPPRYYSRK